MLRHGTGYYLANRRGIDTRTIQSYLGHKSGIDTRNGLVAREPA
ncbi:MAG TPA: hypothetical protein DEF48_05635 [Nostoc sp. UBA8866]|nr:hypothetical protein [Nostoc sp. UBA8866]